MMSSDVILDTVSLLAVPPVISSPSRPYLVSDTG